MNIVCLVVDRLRASALGAYGNTTYGTPALDRLASQSLTVDHALADSSDLGRRYRAFWHGLHPLRPATAAAGRRSFSTWLAEQGFGTWLVTDEPAVAGHPLAKGFHDIVQLEVADRTEPCARIDQTALARLVAVASDRIEEAAAGNRPFLVWIHSRGMTAAWDAPLALRQQLADQDDPPPRQSAVVPSATLPADHDPDDVFAASCAYAGQVMALDACVGGLCQCLEATGAGDRTLLMVLGARGFPLGEHRQIGPAEENFYTESLHVPWLVRGPDLPLGPSRTQALVQPADLPVTVAGVAGLEPPWQMSDGGSLVPIHRAETDELHDRLCIAARNGAAAIRTAAWYYCAAAGQRRLFVKPDDRWETNDVSTRCPDVTAALAEVLESTSAALHSDRPVAVPPLAEMLRRGV